MATTTPLIENIMAFITTELAKITVVNGFRNDVKLVSRDRFDAEKVKDNNFPALFPLASIVTFANQTSQEIEATINIQIIGVTKFNEHSIDEDAAAVKLITLYSDVMEKMWSLQGDDFNGNTEDTFKFTNIEMDEETAFPFAQFRLEGELQLSFSHTDTGRKVQ